MEALTWHGKRDVRVEEVPDPRIEQPTDALVRVTTTAICGSDLHPVLTVFDKQIQPLDEAPRAYETFQRKEDGAVKALLEP